MRTIIIGDIHGCSQPLQALLERVQPAEGDRLIFLGDLFDRGPDSWGVLQIVKQLEAKFGENFVLLRGNHEDYLLQPKLSLMQRMVWDRVGRQATVNSFKQHRERMEDSAPWLGAHCQMYYKGERFQCVHAGLRVDPLEANDVTTLIHDHTIVLNNAYAGPLTITGHIALTEPTWFAGDGKTTAKLPYAEEMTLPERGVLCIDTGCGKGGSLTGLVLEGTSYRLEMGLGG